MGDYAIAPNTAGTIFGTPFERITAQKPVDNMVSNFVCWLIGSWRLEQTEYTDL